MGQEFEPKQPNPELEAFLPADKQREWLLMQMAGGDTLLEVGPWQGDMQVDWMAMGFGPDHPFHSYLCHLPADYSTFSRLIILIYKTEGSQSPSRLGVRFK